MRNFVSQGPLSVRVIAGTRVVFLAIDIAPAERAGLLGFAIGRVDGTGHCTWLEGRKVFPSVVPHPAAKDSFPSNVHPIQSLIWSDPRAHPGTTATYRVQPMYGTPAAPQLGAGVDVVATTEDPTTGSHGVYFNRGAIASQAFSEQFNNQPPKDENDPKDIEVISLSRGALDAALDYIARAQAGDALRVAAYEFTYVPILKALKAAAARGVDVRIVHEAGTEQDKKTKKQVLTSATQSAATAIQALGLDGHPNLTLIKRTRRRKIPHNKFIVWITGGQAKEVLAGSANFTPSGFLGQTNVVHIVRDPAIAEAYLAYWQQLATDPPTPELSTWTQRKTPLAKLDELTSGPGTTTFFSPRKNDDMLKWYAAQIDGATDTVMFTAAFGVNQTLADEFGKPRPFVRFILLEDEPDAILKKAMAADPNVSAAYGSILADHAKSKKPFPLTDLDRWFLREDLYRSEGFVFFIHTKFLLIDPLGDNPLLCTGSANFSSSSLTGNDENMLLIRGDTRVADIYLTEFDRIFRHFLARQQINAIAEEGGSLTDAKFLREDDSWLTGYVTPGRLKTNRQRLFFPNWPH
ncbi:phospholipase D-like domain-containing protein [Pleomorphomonas sp. PLEO]|uniref:phospholipase D-like domain-containing protein n=1 Tax=Pleomorphomonas sp. PLEO TaxID=3239306 RepID=UPI00351DBD6D